VHSTDSYYIKFVSYDLTVFLCHHVLSINILMSLFLKLLQLHKTSFFWGGGMMCRILKVFNVLANLTIAFPGLMTLK
jgi:hypothetical protein